MAETKHGQSDQYKGFLYKWTNYIKGYQKRWFVLQNGLLSYYRNQAEMAHTCRGTINLANAFIHTEDSCSFVINNGGTQTMYLKASSEVERQRWVTALELAKTKAIKMLESEDEEMVDCRNGETLELPAAFKLLNQKMEDLNTCNDLIHKHGQALQRSLAELEGMEHSGETAAKIKAVNERATLFKITSTAMINACGEFKDLAERQGPRWQRLLTHEHDQKLRLEEMVEQIARQTNTLERQARRKLSLRRKPGSQHERGGGGLTSEDEDEFYDAEDQLARSSFDVPLPGDPRNAGPGRKPGMMRDAISSSEDSDDDNVENQPTARVVKSPVSQTESPPSKPGKQHRRTASSGSGSGGKPTSANSSGTSSPNSSRGPSKPSSAPAGVRAKPRRTRIPERPNASLNLWSIMKNSIGKELSKIPLPVNINEPISMLQRITEEFEYASILDRGAECTDSCEQLAHVAAFTISAYATTNMRSGKPFNPLLGETYEFDRTDDLGWRTLFEQVSHHPPTLASHTEGRDWVHWQEFTMSSKFRGKYLQLIPLGIAHLEYQSSGNHYTWRKVATTVHNIIVGKLWVDNHGEMEIYNHKTGDRCHLKYSAYSYFSKSTPRQVTGVITNSKGEARWVLNGTWDNMMEASKVTRVKNEGRRQPVFETGPSKLLWQVNAIPPGNEKIYLFSKLAIELNEFEADVSPTDSRRRPDQRQMETGDWDMANRTKQRLEEKQRAARKKREAENEKAAKEGREVVPYEPTWFNKRRDPLTDTIVFSYKGGYWESKEKQSWPTCPDIYL